MKGWALVTGASQRIGRAIALELATQGWDIIVHYHKSGEAAQKLAEEIYDLGQEACLAEIDLSDPRLAEHLIPSLAEEVGLINVLINNASLFEADAEDADGSRHWAINADAPRLLSKALKAHLPSDEKGVIVNLLDATPAAPNFTSYAKSKEFLTSMTVNMAKSFSPQVRVNGVSPGYVLPSANQSEEAFQKLAAGNVGTPEQVAIAVRNLVETPAVTGQIVTVLGKPH